MLDEKLLIELKQYVERQLSLVNISFTADYLYIGEPPVELKDYIKNNRKPTFSQVLFGLIDKKDVSDADIYKKAGIDRRHFSKIRSNPNYRPGKASVIALALALELNKKEAGKLLSVAGYSLSSSDTFDLIIQFCLEKKIYDIDDVNQALHYFSLKPLAGVAE